MEKKTILLTLCMTGALLTSATPVLALNGITDKDKLSIKLRTIYFDREFENSAADDTTFAQGLEVNYETGVIAKAFTLGVSGYSVQNIDSSGSAGNNILPIDTGNTDGQVDDNIALIGQLFIDVKLGDSGNIKLGRQKHKSLLLSSSGSRAVPNTFLGASSRYQFSGVTLSSFYFTQWSRRYDDGFEDFTISTDVDGDGENDQIDSVWGLGASYKKGGFSGESAYLVSQDYLKKLGLKGAYTWQLKDSRLTFTSGYFSSEGDGDLFVSQAESDLDRNGEAAGEPITVDGSAAFVDLEWKVNALTFGVAYTEVDEFWIEDNFNADHGTNPFPTRAAIGPDLTNTNENIWALRLGFDLNHYVRGLRTTVSRARGSDAQNSVLRSAGGTASEEWWSLDTKWSIPSVKGLSFRWFYLDYDGDESAQSVRGIRPDTDNHRVYLDYTFSY